MSTPADKPTRPKHLSSELLDTVPPHDAQAERALIATILLDHRRIAEAAAIVRPEDFYDQRLGKLFANLEFFIKHTGGIDVTAFTSWLKGHPADFKIIAGTHDLQGAERLVFALLLELWQQYPTASYASYYAQTIRNHARRRRLIAVGQSLIQAGYSNNGKSEQLRRAACEELQAINDNRPVSETLSFARMVTSQELANLELSPQFLVRGILVAGQPMVVGGRSKTLKTSLTIDLAISLATATPFLGHFEVPLPTRVGFWTGESGAAVVKETASRIAQAKGVSLPDCPIWWSFALPRLSDVDHLDALARAIEQHELQVAIIDPLYLALLTIDTAKGASNIFAMGAVLEPLSRLAQETGVTLIMLHHFRKSGTVDDAEPAGLDELAMSGAGEWARQWILLQRRAPYRGDGMHTLWLRAGGSAGHASLWGITVNEGTTDPANLEERRWEVTVSSMAEVRTEVEHEQQRQRAQREEERQRQRALREEARDNQRAIELLGILRQLPEGETVRYFRARTGWRTEHILRALCILAERGQVASCTITRRNSVYEAYKWTGR